MERDVQFIGQSGAFLDAVERTSRAAPLRRPVLVIGERGTGKELIAERLHQLSKRWAEPLVTLNCAALPETLIEAELFGHEAGAFTGGQMREDPEFFADYMAGHYDKTCPDCQGSGKIKIADRARMTKQQKRAWRDELEMRAEDRAIERAEYRMSAEYLAEMKGGY